MSWCGMSESSGVESDTSVKRAARDFAGRPEQQDVELNRILPELILLNHELVNECEKEH
jgi:hypothetical protein